MENLNPTAEAPQQEVAAVESIETPQETAAEPSRVPRGPANYTASLTSQRHRGKFPKVPDRKSVV